MRGCNLRTDLYMYICIYRARRKISRQFLIFRKVIRNWVNKNWTELSNSPQMCETQPTMQGRDMAPIAAIPFASALRVPFLKTLKIKQTQEALFFLFAEVNSISQVFLIVYRDHVTPDNARCNLK